MTREEVFFEVLKNRDGEVIEYGKVYEIINEIYDDFESRVCKNCFYYFEGTCVCDESPLVTEIVDENYGCNKFKEKR
jgi:hypothetical protein